MNREIKIAILNFCMWTILCMSGVIEPKFMIQSLITLYIIQFIFYIVFRSRSR